MKKVIAIIRPSRVDAVCDRLAEETDLAGITVTDVRGTDGRGIEPVGLLRDGEYVVLPRSVKIELSVSDDEVDRAVEVIVEQARTGQEGDGKVFVVNLGDAIRIRTGDRGKIAI